MTDTLCGILNVDKPAGLTSHQVVVIVRRLARQRKVGHAGTLDPMATGVLLVCLGKATRVTQYLMRSPKVYQAVIHLGISTTTHDIEGQVTRESPVCVTRQEAEAALKQFIGHVKQVPPMYSAIKRDGQPLYKLARRGISVERPPREVTIHSLRITAWAPPIVHLTIRSGPGTYIRALARDLGEALGCGAHLCALRRTRSGQFSVAHAVTLEQLQGAFAIGTGATLLHPLDAAFYRLPAIRLDAEMSLRLAMGQQVQDPGGAGQSRRARAYGPGDQFIALVHRDPSTGDWKPHQVFVAPDRCDALAWRALHHLPDNRPYARTD